MRSESVIGHSVPYSSDPTSVGYLSAVPENISEESLMPHQRIPRFTTGTHCLGCPYSHVLPVYFHGGLFFVIFVAGSDAIFYPQSFIPLDILACVTTSIQLDCSSNNEFILILPHSAQWSFESGGLASLVHGAVLQGRRYEASLDVWADGLRMALEDPYSEKCTLRIRRGIRVFGMYLHMYII